MEGETTRVHWTFKQTFERNVWSGVYFGMTYETLKAGDVLKKGDEVRSILNDQARQFFEKNKDFFRTNMLDWFKTSLVGHEILRSDMCHLEFRRPVK